MYIGLHIMNARARVRVRLNVCASIHVSVIMCMDGMCVCVCKRTCKRSRAYSCPIVSSWFFAIGLWIWVREEGCWMRLSEGVPRGRRSRQSDKTNLISRFSCSCCVEHDQTPEVYKEDQNERS